MIADITYDLIQFQSPLRESKSYIICDCTNLKYEVTHAIAFGGDWMSAAFFWSHQVEVFGYEWPKLVHQIKYNG